MQENKVSIIIPTYNSSNTIIRAINSVLNQTYQNYEIIVIDDGSSDNTKDLLNNLIFNKQIRYFFQENMGQGVARNLGIQNSTGNWIAFLDSDDEWMKDKLKLQMMVAKKEPDVGLVFTNAEFVKKNKRFGVFFEDFCRQPNLKENMFKQLLENNFIVNSSVVVQREALNNVGFFSPDQFFRNIEDYDLWLRIITKYKIRLVNEVLVRYALPDKNKRSILHAQKQKRKIYWGLLLSAPFFNKLAVIKKITQCF